MDQTSRPTIPNFPGFHGPAPSAPGSPPPQAVRSVLEWFLAGSTPDELSPRIAYAAQSLLSLAARKPGVWVDVSSSFVRSDLVLPVVAAATADSALPIFTSSRLVFESQGTRIRFVQGPA